MKILIKTIITFAFLCLSLTCLAGEVTNSQLGKTSEEMGKQQRDSMNAYTKKVMEDIKNAPKMKQSELYCSAIKDEDSRLECMSGIELSRGNIEQADFYCHRLWPAGKSEEYADAFYGCMSNVEITRGNIQQADYDCVRLVHSGSEFSSDYYGCMSGLEMAKGDIKQAELRCSYIRDDDARYGCLSGIEIAKGDLHQAWLRCTGIHNQDGYRACMSGVELEKEMIAAQKNNK